MSEQKKTTKTYVCANCGGQLDVDETKDKVICPYCGTSYKLEDILNESDAVRIERIKTKASTDLEHEKLVNEMNIAAQQEKNDSVNTFKKGKLSKFLIAFIILGALMALGYFNKVSFIKGLLSTIMVALFVVSYLMGMGVIKEQRHNFRLIPAIAGFAMLGLIVFIGNGSSSSSNIEKINWSNIQLGEYIPEPPVDKGEIITNTSENLTLKYNNISSDQYYSYLNSCKDKNYTVDVDEIGSSYDAFNDAGYKLDLSYYKSSKEMRIDLEAPEKLGTLEWPTTDAGKQLPVPNSKVGTLKWGDNNKFLIYVGNTTIDDYNQYIKACSEKGFTNDIEKGDKYYRAKNSANYSLNLTYEGGNRMRIEVQLKDAAASATATASAATTAPTPTPEATAATSAVGVTPSFKEAMDSYEAFFDQYIAFMQKYKDSTDTTSMLADYASYMSQYADTMAKMDAIDEKTLSPADDAYYLEVTARIEQKLLAVA